jgi:hypothetical protein
VRHFLLLFFLSTFSLNIGNGLSAKNGSWTYLEYQLVAACAASHHKDLVPLYFDAKRFGQNISGPPFFDQISDCVQMYKLPKAEGDQERAIRHFLVVSKFRVAGCVIDRLESTVIDRQDPIMDLRNFLYGEEFSDKAREALGACDGDLAANIANGDTFSKFLLQSAAKARGMELAKIESLLGSSEEPSIERRVAICFWQRASLHAGGFYTLIKRTESIDLDQVFIGLFPILAKRCPEFVVGTIPEKFLEELSDVGKLMEGPGIIEDSPNA